jgi:hypothetical protein
VSARGGGRACVSVGWREPEGSQLCSTAGLHRDAGELQAYVAEGFATAHDLNMNPRKWWWESGDRFRLAVIEPHSGDVSLAEGGACLVDGGWQRLYEELLAELREAAS